MIDVPLFAEDVSSVGILSAVCVADTDADVDGSAAVVVADIVVVADDVNKAAVEGTAADVFGSAVAAFWS